MIYIGDKKLKQRFIGDKEVLQVYIGNHLIWEANNNKPYPSYLTFISTSTFSLKTQDSTKHWTNKLEYSKDGQTWQEWSGIMLSANSPYKITDSLSIYRLMLRGTGNTSITNNLINSGRWVINGTEVSCFGNIETLLDYTKVEQGEHPTIGQGCFAGLFNGCNTLITAPELGFTTFNINSCNSMFHNCTNLITIPRIYATNFEVEGCCQSMFQGCKKIQLSTTQSVTDQIPYKLPAIGTGTFNNTGTALQWMFDFKGTENNESMIANINTIYYTNNAIIGTIKSKETSGSGTIIYSFNEKTNELIIEQTSNKVGNDVYSYSPVINNNEIDDLEIVILCDDLTESPENKTGENNNG